MLWVGTDEGLNRYDGYGVTVYRSNPFDDKTISGNRVWTSFKDIKGNDLGASPTHSDIHGVELTFYLLRGESFYSYTAFAAIDGGQLWQ